MQMGYFMRDFARLLLSDNRTKEEFSTIVRARLMLFTYYMVFPFAGGFFILAIVSAAVLVIALPDLIQPLGLFIFFSTIFSLSTGLFLSMFFVTLTLYTAVFPLMTRFNKQMGISKEDASGMTFREFLGKFDEYLSKSW